MSAQILIYREDGTLLTQKDKKNVFDTLSKVKSIRPLSQIEREDGFYVSVYLARPKHEYPSDANMEKIKEHTDRFFDKLPKYKLSGKLIWVSGDPQL